MNRVACISLRLLFAYVAFMVGVPGHSLSKDLIAAESGTEVEGDEGRILANLSPEVLNTLESVAGVGSSDSTSNLRASRVYMVAGTGELGFKGDGELATRAHLWFAAAVAVDAGGNIVIADSFNNRVRRVDARTGKIQTVAGIGRQGFFGDGDLATKAQLNSPSGVAVDHQGNIFIADTFNNRIRVIDAQTGIISTLAGTGKQGSDGDDGLAIRAQLSGPTGISVDRAGNLLIADTANHRIRQVEKATGVISTLAGTGTPGFSKDGGIGTTAELNGPTAVVADGHGRVLIADTFNNRVRLLDTRIGTITTIAGTGAQGFGGDGDFASKAELMEPSGVAVDTKGNILIADTFNNRIRQIDHLSGIITTVVGVGTRGSSEGGTRALFSELNNPVGLTQDALGNIVVADAGNHRVLRVIAEAP